MNFTLDGVCTWRVRTEDKKYNKGRNQRHCDDKRLRTRERLMGTDQKKETSNFGIHNKVEVYSCKSREE